MPFQMVSKLAQIKTNLEIKTWFLENIMLENIMLAHFVADDVSNAIFEVNIERSVLVHKEQK